MEIFQQQKELSAYDYIVHSYKTGKVNTQSETEKQSGID